MTTSRDDIARAWAEQIKTLPALRKELNDRARAEYEAERLRRRTLVGRMIAQAVAEGDNKEAIRKSKVATIDFEDFQAYYELGLLSLAQEDLEGRSD